MAARSPADVRRAAAEGRIALIAAIESGDQLDGSLGRLRELYARGLRAVTIVYDHHNDLGDGAMAYEQSRAVAGPAAGGLSPFGRDVVREMNRLGMIVDVAHAAEVTANDAIAMSTAPVVFTHVNARAIADTPRNVSDDTLRRLAAKGGLVMVSFVPYLVSPAYLAWFTEGERRYAALMAAHPGDRAAIAAGMAVWDQTHPQPVVTVAEVANHIEHIARVAGDDLVIAIENNCAAGQSSEHGTQVGLRNVRERLTAVYGTRGHLDTVKRDDGYRATLRLPRVIAP